MGSSKGTSTGKKPAKAAPIAKSILLLEIKPMEAETDLDALYARILKELQMDGCMWKTEYEKEPIAFGVHKLIMGVVVEDLKVSPDEDIIAKLETWEDVV